jgi:hypothetical protein
VQGALVPRRANLPCNRPHEPRRVPAQSVLFPNTVPIAMEHERDNVFRVEIRGTLRKTDLERCQERLVGEMRRLGPVKLLFVLDGFEGWERQANWNDLSFYVKHGDNIERIAIVGDQQWRSEALMFAGADLRRGPVEFFSEDAIGDARAWLTV